MTSYANGSYQRASGTRAAFAAWSADLVSEGYPEVTVNSGDRETERQEQIFRDKFDPSSGPRDVGPYNDRRLWPGHGYWKRVKGGGTVGVPGTSNHERRRAADLAYPYNSDTPAHRRAQVLAKRHNITCEGMGFSEWWHWTFWGPLGSVDTSGAASTGTTGGKAAKPTIPPTGVPDMFLFYAGTLTATNAYLATYDGRALKVRPTQGIEAKALIAAMPNVPRVQLEANEVVDLCSQGGYSFDQAAGVGRDSEGRIYVVG